MKQQSFCALVALVLAPFLALAAPVPAPSAGRSAPPVTVTLQQGVNGYEGTEDTMLSNMFRPPKYPTNRSFGSSKEFTVCEKTPAAVQNTRVLIRFDLSKVRGTIVGAQLVLKKAAQNKKNPVEAIAVYRVADANKDWQAGTVNNADENEVAVWSNKSEPSIPWAGGPGLVAGADYDPTPLAEVETGENLNVPITWTFTEVAFLNDWAAHPSHNAGFLLQESAQSDDGDNRFFSADADQTDDRPKLVLTVIPLTPSASCYEDAHPPIPLKFTLKEPGYVTLAIDNAQGKRVRNLVSETLFPAGENTAWWDGLDESGQVDVSPRGHYKIKGKLVDIGTYRVRGLVRKQLDLVYEFPTYNPGNPPWPVSENTESGWLADHSPPREVLFLPGDEPRILIGSYIVEGGSSLAWVDLEGHKKRGMGWLGGGNWTGVGNLARDVGNKPVPNVQVYACTTWPGASDVELRLIAIGEKANKPVLIYPFPKLPGDKPSKSLLGGLVARNGLVYATLPSRNQLLIIDAAAGKLLKTLVLNDGRGITFDTNGRLLALVGKQVLRLTVPLTPEQAATITELPAGELLVREGLEDPQRIALDSTGNLYVSDLGNGHNVKVFSGAGRFVRAIGKAGVPKVGLYDPQRMNNPCGVAVSSDGHLWVAEQDEAPRRVSVWNLDGTFVKAFYGGPRYGGGGMIDPRDKTRFYYGPDNYGMEFKIDWERGSSQLLNVYYRESDNEHGMGGSPETPIYAFGHQYMTNANNEWLMGGKITRLWIMRDGVAVPVAMAGRVNQWKGFQEDAFKALLPQGDEKDLEKKYLNDWFFAWSDRNGDGQVQPEELTFKQVPENLRSWIAPVTVGDGLALLINNGYCVKPTEVTKSGVPIYDMETSAPVFNPVTRSRFQAVDMGADWTIQAGGPIYGYQKGEVVWSYPCRWPGLSSMYGDPLEEPRPGEIVGLTHLAGPQIEIPGSDLGPVWAVDANNGTISLLTRDGLFVGTLGVDSRRGRPIRSTPDGHRGLSLNGNTFGEEHFFLNVCQTPEGKVYVVAAFGIVRVDGLETAKRLPDQTLNLTPELMAHAAEYVVSGDSAPRLKKKQKPLAVFLPPKAPMVDGVLEDWAGAEWVTIHPANNKKTGEGKVEAAIAISGDRLYAAFKTGDSRLLSSNTGESIESLFKSGGALDLMIGTDPKANPKRTTPVAGDIRLLVTFVNERVVAALYRAVVPGTKKPVPFSSPWRTITLDRVDDVSNEVQFPAKPGQKGLYEFSIPLSVLGVQAAQGQTLRGDVGILRGNAGATVERIYWSNKATGLTADVPGEAMLTPQMWGEWQIGQPIVAPK